jgi:hypothetical protein
MPRERGDHWEAAGFAPRIRPIREYLNVSNLFVTKLAANGGEGLEIHVFRAVRHLCRSVHGPSQNDRFGPNLTDLS